METRSNTRRDSKRRHGPVARVVVGAIVSALAMWSCGARTGMDLDVDDPDVGAVAQAGADASRPETRPSPGAEPTDPAPTDPVRPVDPSSCREVTGLWAGTWTTTSGLSGTWRTEMRENGNAVISGDSAVTGTACGSQSSISGRRDGCTIAFGLADFSSCSVDFVGTIDGTQMSGTFSVTAGFTDRGTWSGTKVR